MSLPTSVADVIGHHVTLTVECVDRLYLNVIQSRLQVERGIAYFFRQHRGEQFATAKTMAEITRPFVAAIERFVQSQGLDLLIFSRRQRKDQIAREYLAKFTAREGILFVGKAPERAAVVRTISQKNPRNRRRHRRRVPALGRGEAPPVGGRRRPVSGVKNGSASTESRPAAFSFSCAARKRGLGCVGEYRDR